jgi:TM2 domain-containing membrane protein YozV
VFTSAAGCDSVATLNLLVVPVLSSSIDSVVCENETPVVWNGVEYAVSGVYSAVFNSAARCDSVATLNLLVVPVLTSSIDSVVCENQVPVVWNGVEYAVSGIYSASFTSAAGCDSVATLNLLVVPVLSSSIDSVVCENQVPVVWNGVEYAVSGVYSAVFNSAAGCDSVATLNLTIVPVLSSSIDSVVCENQVPVVWNGVEYAVSGIYSAAFTSAAGCDSVATLNLLVVPVLSSSIDSVVCENETPVVWNGVEYAVSGVYTAAFTSVAGCDSVATLNLTIVPVLSSSIDSVVCENQVPVVWNGVEYAVSGVYTAGFNSVAGCDSVATLNLLVVPVLSSSIDTVV